MALVVADRVQETTTTTGTGTYTLAGAKDGFQSFAAVGNGNTTYYACTDGTDYEVGIGTYTASGTTLARTTIIESSNSDAAVDWSAGDKDIFVTLPASKALVQDASDDVTLADNEKLIFGTGSDLEIYHDGTYDWIKSSATQFRLASDEFQFYKGNTFENLAKFNADSDVELYYDNSKKFETTSTGINVIGNVAVSGTVDGVDVATNIPSSLGTAGQVLTVNSGETAGEWASLPSASLAQQEFTATSGQTVFTVTDGISDADNVSVYINGVKLFSTDVTISASANTVTLGSGAATGDLVTVTEITGTSGGGGASAFTGLSDTPASLGSAGQTLQVASNGSALEFADASSGSGVTVHNNQAAMLTDAGSADEGTLHYENNTNKLYVKQSSGFYLLASITNVAPTIDSFSEATGGASANNLTADGTFTLTAGSDTVITINATEPNLETISYSATVTSGTATDVFSSPSFPVSNQSSNQFTLTPATSGGGTVTIRFDASDGSNVANVSHSFSITFSIWTSSATRTTVTDSSSSYTRYGQGPVASNHDATHLIIPALGYNNDTGAVVYWTRSGTTFTEQGKLGTSLSGNSTYVGSGCAGNRDLTKLIVGSFNGHEYWTRSGSTWTQRTTNLTNNAVAHVAFSDSSNYILCNGSTQKYIIGTAGATSLGNWSASLGFTSYNSNRGPCAISGNGNYVMMAITESSYGIYYNGSSTDDGSWGTANSPSNSMGSNTLQFSTTSNIQTNTADSYGIALNRDGSIAVYTDYNYGVNVIKRSGTSWSITQRFTPNSSDRWQRVSISEDGDVILLSGDDLGFQVWEGNASTGTGYTQSATYDDSSFVVYPNQVVVNTSSGLSRDGKFFFAGFYNGIGGNANYGYAYTP